MGYIEIVCQLCGVSSNISRIRRPDEPRLASWCGDDRFAENPLGDSYIRMAMATKDRECTDCYIRDLVLVGDDSEGDSEYSYQSSNGSEPYEYATPDDSDEDMAERDTAKVSKPSATGDGFSDEYQRFVDSTKDRHCLWKETFHHVSNYSVKHAYMEHIAGKECISTDGYSGHRIALEEMKGCDTFQCLVPKAHWWSGPLSDDEDFEIHDDFFLSGLVDFMNSKDLRPKECSPQRHNRKSPLAKNCFYHEEDIPYTCMPFHPTCLEVYKRASLHRFGKVDIKGLTDWYRLEATYDDFFTDFPRHAAVRRGLSQWWKHVPGDEWLVANPCFVPDLERMLYLVRQYEASPKAECYSDDVGTDTAALYRDADDCFVRLPMELLLFILKNVDGKELASLRLASRAFRQLPQSVFHDLLLREFPWIWESWCSLPYAWWATTTQTDIIANEDAWAERKHDLENWRIPVLAETRELYGYGGNELLIEALKERLKVIKQEEIDFRKPCPVTTLSKTTPDWRRLYVELARNRHKVKGLRKREIVWRDCQYILDRIEHHRAEGRMGEGIDIDPVKIFRERERRNAVERNSAAGFSGPKTRLPRVMVVENPHNTIDSTQ